MSNNKFLLDALITKYEGDVASAKANLKVYQTNPAGIGEHPDIISAMDIEMEKLTAADEKLQMCYNLKSDEDELSAKQLLKE